MKKLILAAVLVVGSTGVVHASEPFQFGIGMCQYGWSERGNTILVGVKDYGMPKQVREEQDKYCSSKANMEEATAAYVKYLKVVQEEEESKQRQERWIASAEGQESLRRQGEENQKVEDVYKACLSGVESDGKAYMNLLSKYAGKPGMINTLRKARDYGDYSAAGPRQCVNYQQYYIMGY